MAAGDLITADYQVELRGTMWGDRTTSWVQAQIGGLLIPTVRSQDVALDHRDGAAGGLDTLGPRLVTIPMLLDGSILLSTVEKWLPSARTDIPLHIRLPVFGHISMMGRPRGLVESVMSLDDGGTIAVMARFEALTPTITTVSP